MRLIYSHLRVRRKRVRDCSTFSVYECNLKVSRTVFSACLRVRFQCVYECVIFVCTRVFSACAFSVSTRSDTWHLSHSGHRLRVTIALMRFCRRVYAEEHVSRINRIKKHRYARLKSGRRLAYLMPISALSYTALDDHYGG